MAGPGDERSGRVTIAPRKLRELSIRALGIRFVFGAGVSLLAGVVSTVWGARAGGVFLAFPAILLASMTLIAKEVGMPARGTTCEARRSGHSA
jgi:hypothetical protein